MTVREQTVNLGELPLDGRYLHSAQGLAIVAPPHPLYGGSLDVPVVEALSAGLQMAGLGTLRFNNRGVGRSGGSPSGALEDAVQDYHAAVEWAQAQQPSRLILAGYSLGAVAALHVHLSGVACAGLLLVAPPTDMLPAEGAARMAAPVWLCQGDEDHYVDMKRCKAWLEAVPTAATLRGLAGADHFLAYELSAIREFAREAATALACGSTQL